MRVKKIFIPDLKDVGVFSTEIEMGGWVAELRNLRLSDELRAAIEGELLQQARQQMNIQEKKHDNDT